MTGPRSTQRSAIFELLRSRVGQWVSLPEILGLGFAQFGARILELRRDVYTIVNKTEHREGKVLSWYRLELLQSPKEQQRGVGREFLTPARNVQPDRTIKAHELSS